MEDLNEFTNKLKELKEKLEAGELEAEQEINSLLEDYPSKPLIGVKRLSPDVMMPKYNYGGDSGFDFYSTEDVVIGNGKRALVPTGLSFDIPENTELQVRSKSGLAINKGLFVLNSPGTVDSSYTGEVKVILQNLSGEEILITKGSKIAQGVFAPVFTANNFDFVEVGNIPEKDRGDKGFGSTGQ